MLLQNATRTSRTLNELKRAGVKLAIQNFGASYLSLTSIRNFPIDTLKVDRSLLRDIDQLGDPGVHRSHRGDGQVTQPDSHRRRGRTS